MTIDYVFEDESTYTYEVDINSVESEVVKLLCGEVRAKHKSMYDDIGAYQMAMYVVYDLDVIDALIENYRDELYDIFYDKAYEQYKERLENSNEEEDWYGTIRDVRGV